MNSTQTVGVFFGGMSAEHDVSIITGQYIISQLKKIGHQVVPVYVDTQGRWHVGDDLGALSFFKDKKDLSAYRGWSVESRGSQMIISRSSRFKKQQLILDVVFPAFHGTNGEDGTFQGYCQFLNVPFVGAALESSVIAMNKILTKQALVAAGINTPAFVTCNRKQWSEEKQCVVDRTEDSLSYPVFIKPPHAGSSIGVSCAHNTDELIQSIDLALHYDHDCLIEEGVQGARDVTVAVMGNDELRTTVGQESHSSDDMLSYEDKYINDGGAQFGGSDTVMTIPAEMKQETETEMMDLARQVFTLLGLSGTSRVDFLLDENETISVIEVNPLPGTLYNHLWEQSGVSGTQLVQQLIELGLEAHQKRNEVSYEFNSSILQHANNMKLRVD